MYKLKNIRKIATIFLVLGLSLFFIIGCGANDKEEKDTRKTDIENAVELVDDSNQELILNQHPERIISTMPNITEILFALDKGEKVVGVTDYCYYPEEAQEKESIGDSFNLDVEKIIDLDPDIVLMGLGETMEEVGVTLEEFEIKTAFFHPYTIEDIYDLIYDIGEITGATDKAKELVTEMQTDKEEILEVTSEIDEDQKPRIFVLQDDQQLFTVGEGEFLNEAIEIAGGINIGAKHGEGYIQLDPETLVEENPDVIIKSFPISEDIENKPGWSSLKAVQEDNVYEIDGDLFSRPGPRIMQGVLELKEIIEDYWEE